MSDYKEKYIKYKNKYILLKNKMHGGVVINGNVDINTIVTNVLKNKVIRAITPKYQCIINSIIKKMKKIIIKKNDNLLFFKRNWLKF